MVASIPRILPALNYLMSQILAYHNKNIQCADKIFISIKVYLCHRVKFQFQLDHEHKVYILSQSSTENVLIEPNEKSET
jgi:hypothetical protein